MYVNVKLEKNIKKNSRFEQYFCFHFFTESDRRLWSVKQFCNSMPFSQLSEMGSQLFCCRNCSVHHFTLYTLYCISLYTLQCTQYITSYVTLYTVHHFKRYPVHCTLYITSHVTRNCHISKRGDSQEIVGQKRGIFFNIKGQIRGKDKRQILIWMHKTKL